MHDPAAYLAPDVVLDVTGVAVEEAGPDTLNGAPRKALADPEVAPKLLTAGIEPATSSPDELRAFMVAEIAKWRKIVADCKIEPE